MYPNAGTCTVHARHARCICIRISMRVCVNVCGYVYIYIFSVCVACVLRVWLDLGEIERDKILIRR